jgi:hypothetical protein
MDFNPTEMRRRFAELRANRTRIEEKLAPMHAEIEELRTSTRKREDEPVSYTHLEPTRPCH